MRVDGVDEAKRRPVREQGDGVGHIGAGHLADVTRRYREKKLGYRAVGNRAFMQHERLGHASM